MPSADILLRPAPEVIVEFDATGDTVLVVGPRRVAAGRHGPAILDAFRPGRSLRDALERLAPHSDGAEWMRLASVLREAVERDVLVAVDGDADVDVQTAPQHRRRGFSAVSVHVAMLDDAVRTGTFCEAIARTVRPGDVVVDVGTGSGVLAVAAARAGARRVYAIEVSDMAGVATEVAEANGFGDVIQVVRGWSTEIELPERADVVVTETIGNDPLAEQILTVVADAAERFLRPGGRIIPQCLEVLGWPVEVPPEMTGRPVPSDDQLGRWRAAYGVDLSALVGAAGDLPVACFPAASEVGRWRRLGPGRRLLSLPLPAGRRIIDGRADLAVTTVGTLGGVAIGFRCELTDDVDLVVGPGRKTSWRPISYILPVPSPVGVGDRVRVSFSHALSSRLGVTVEPGPKRFALSGLVLASEVPLGDLEVVDDDDAPVDVHVRRRPIETLPELITAGRRVQVGPHDAVLAVGEDRIHVRDGREILLDGPPEAGVARDLTILGAAWAAVCLQRGWLPLHASSVVGPHGAIAFCGDRGAGKTTVCALLDAAGMPLLADDLTPVRWESGTDAGAAPEALAGVRRFKLREDVLARLGLDAQRQPALIMDGERKFPVPAWSPLPDREAHPLVALVVLVPDRSCRRPVIESLAGVEAVAAVHGAWFRPRWTVEPTINRAVAAGALRVAGAVQVLRLRRPVDPESLPDTMTAAARLVRSMG